MWIPGENQQVPIHDAKALASLEKSEILGLWPIAPKHPRSWRAARKRGVNVTLSIMGRGEVDAFKSVVISQGLQDFVSFLGPQSHSEVVGAMRSHDAVVVPSHWSYPEGLPMTLYEALCTRTPLLTSDHPMFALKIRDGYNALVFPERNPEAFANRIEELWRSPELYSRLSANSLAADAYLCPLKYDQLISGFLGLNSSLDLRQFSLASSYPDLVEGRRGQRGRAMAGG